MLRRFLPLVAAGVLSCALAACGGSSTTVTRTTTVTSTPPITYMPPESSRTPEGAKPAPTPVGVPLGVSVMHIDARGLALIEGFEGYDRCAYWDPYGHVWTAGFGQTQGVYAGFCFASRAAAEANLKLSVEESYEPYIRALHVAFDQNEWDALCSFAYNLGGGIFTGTSVGADLRDRDFGAATRAMLGYVYASGVVVPGLVTRRREEVALFDTPEPKPKPQPLTNAQFRAKLATLDAELGAYSRRNRRGHNCAHPPYRHAFPSRRWNRECGTWAREARQVKREVAKRR